MTNKVVLLNHDSLRNPAIPVDDISLNYVIEAVVPKMIEVMKAEEGLGLAANQIDDPHAVFIMEIEGELKTYINPEILEQSEEVIHEEACLSIPGVTGKVKRFNKLKLKFQDEKLATQEVELTGLKAIAVQHEVDHLQGKLYIDRLGLTSRNMLMNKYKKSVKFRSRMA